MEHGTFLGWIGDDVLHSLYRIADVCVVPSIYEPFGLVALEAMASGCPCIVADTGGLREVVPHEEAGLRFRARDPEALGRGGRARAHRRRARPTAWSPRPTSTCALRLGRRRRAHRGALRRARRRAQPRLDGPRVGRPSPGATARPGSASAASSAPRASGSPCAGTPPTTAFAGTSLVTTALVPTIALSPTRTPRRMQAP